MSWAELGLELRVERKIKVISEYLAGSGRHIIYHLSHSLCMHGWLRGGHRQEGEPKTEIITATPDMMRQRDENARTPTHAVFTNSKHNTINLTIYHI